MTWRRWLPTFLVLTIVLAGALAWVRGRPVAPVDVQILAVASPRTLVAGEAYHVEAGIEVPGGRFEQRFHACVGGRCVQSGRQRLDGPVAWWGYAGTIEVPEGRHTAGVTVHARTVGPAWRPVARYEWEVVARDAR